MCREADIVSGRNHLVGDHPALQAAHPVGEHDVRDTAELLEALRQHRQCGLGPLVVGEPHEPDPRPGQHRAEHVQPADTAPVDGQDLTRRPHRRTTAPVVAPPPGLLRIGDKPPEVPRRPRIASRLRGRQQPLGRDPALRHRDPVGHQSSDRVVVVFPRLADRRLAPGLGPLDDALDRPPSCIASSQAISSCCRSSRDRYWPSAG
jgi:hypothetical protein